MPIRRQQKYIANHASRKDIKIYPKDGCGDPKAIKVSKYLVFLFIDSQWWVHDWEKEETINKGCKVKSRREFLDRIKNLIIEHKNDQIIIFMHHPLVSNGEHGGHFSAKTHLFPVPVVGSIYALARQLGISPQDNTNVLLRELHHFLKSVIHTYDTAQVTFASGHDHFLQHTSQQVIFQKFPINYIISGSGYKEGFAARGLGASFVYAQRGYSTISFFEDGSAWLDFYVVEENGSAEKLEYRQELYKSKPRLEEYDFETDSEGLPDDIVIAPNVDFGKGSGYRFVLGDQYREAWTIPVKTEIFHLDKYYVGLKPVKKGGGLFSKTLRLENGQGKQYVLRSMNKDFFKAVPENIQHLELLQLYADQNTVSIPYGALYIAALSKYANVYHTEPQMVYLKDVEELGPFAPYFDEGPYLLEVRPDGDWSDSDLFGSSEEIIGYNDLLSVLRKKSTHIVDQRWTLRSRLFDILIHDRDRHDDQWRWAAFDENDRTIYRPIPRDRDWAFFKYEGLIPSIMGNVVDKKLKSFKADEIDIKSLATNANHFDRYFLNELTWEDWQEELAFLKGAMTEEAIANSFAALPTESRPYLKSELEEKLTSRINILEKEVKKYYDFISEEIEVTGTDDDDNFEITILENGDVQVVHNIEREKKRNVKRYDRIIESDETKKIRIYELAGKDNFQFRTRGETDIHIAVIGGIGNDAIDCKNCKLSNKIEVYDSEEGIEIDNLDNISDHRNGELITNVYRRRGFLYDTGLPWLNIDVSPDDGPLIGVGFSSIKHGWRKSPYRASHFFNFKTTPARGFGMSLNYVGEFTDVFGKGWAFSPELLYEAPDYINYFGLGENSNILGSESSFNWVRKSSWSLQTNAVKRMAGGKIKFSIGPEYESHNLNTEDGSILLQLVEFSEDDFEGSHFLGLHSTLRIFTLDKANNPSRGFNIKTFAKHQYDLGEDNHVLSYGGTVSFFIPLSISFPIVLGSNTGYTKLIGDPLFYQLPSAGGKRSLRPSRSHRLRGESTFCQQFDLRLSLFMWNNSLLPMRIGAIGGYDFGKTYYRGEDTGPINHGWTAGLSFDLIEYFVLSTSFSGGFEGTQIVFATGFSF